MSIKKKLYNYKLNINSKKDQSTVIHSTSVLTLINNIIDLTYTLL